MGGNYCADGNTMKIAIPPTEPVPNLKDVEEALLFSQIPGKKDWPDFFRSTLREDYPNERDLLVVVKKCCDFVSDEFPYLPTKVMDIYRAEQAFNSMAACK
jgi:hypothetical protein